MFYEVVYTRCRHGIDLLKKGRTVTGDGYKVYDANRELLNDEMVDLSLLVNAAKSKQSYSDPLFMDDAYLYYVPDIGNSFLVDFHPIPFNPNVKGDYSKRPGNFINHGLVGDFSEVYAFEMFNDKEIWTAKEREEAYYYANEPASLCVGQKINSPPGQYTVDDIKAFIADERQEAVKQAVSFLNSQFELVPETRKFLVIRDDTTQNIELWIAAIELAFSPRMAAGLSFATRLDKFSSSNKYTVNQLGLYQQQINLQDPKQSLRYRAMIVGVINTDKANANIAKPLQNSPFVLLDGKQKKAMFSENVTDRYYDLITRFDDEHICFCREFMQTFGITAPSKAILYLYKSYCSLADDNISAMEYASILKELKKYELFRTSTLRGLYKQANKKVEEYLCNDFKSALVVMDWIQSAAFILHDVTAELRLTDVIKNTFIQKLYSKDNHCEVGELWAMIKESEFASSVVSDVVNPSIIKGNQQQLTTMNAEELLQIVNVYFNARNLISSNDEEMSKAMARYCVEGCFREKNSIVLKKLNATVSARYGTKLQDFWLDVAKSSNENISIYIAKSLLYSDKVIAASESELLIFCRKLAEDGYDFAIPYAIERYIKGVPSLSELEHFLKDISFMEFLSRENILHIYKIADERIGVSLKGTKNIAQLLQSVRQENDVYTNSAHIMAAYSIIYYQKKSDLLTILPVFVSQGFPSVVNDEYINELIAAIEKKRLESEEYAYIAKLFISAPPEYFSPLVEVSCLSATKKADLWNCILVVANREKRSSLRNQIRALLVGVLVETKQNKKSLKTLGELIQDDSTYKYYRAVADGALKIIESQSQNGFKKIFDMWKKD